MYWLNTSGIHCWLFVSALVSRGEMFFLNYLPILIFLQGIKKMLTPCKRNGYGSFHICFILARCWFHLSCGTSTHVLTLPIDLLAKVLAVLVDAFGDKLHWFPQSLLYLPKKVDGRGLMHLASKGATFHLDFIKILLTGSKDLVWKLGVGLSGFKKIW